MTAVHVCPIKDSECGHRPDNWCDDCPLRKPAAMIAQSFGAVSTDADAVVTTTTPWANPEVKRVTVPEVAAALTTQAQPAPCIGGNPACPCQDGDACHYRDTATTKAWPIPAKPAPAGYCARASAGVIECLCAESEQRGCAEWRSYHAQPAPAEPCSAIVACDCRSTEECWFARSHAAIEAGDGTLHGAIDYWQARALEAEGRLAAPVSDERIAGIFEESTCTLWPRPGDCVSVSAANILAFARSLLAERGTPATDIDEAALQRLSERGSQAWADVPDATQWVDELRGAPSDALVEAARLALEALASPRDAQWNTRCTRAIAALRAALPPERKPVLNPMCAWPFPEKKL